MKVASLLYKYSEYKAMYLYFNDNFKLEDVSDDIIIDMLDNIQNRLLYINATFYCNDNNGESQYSDDDSYDEDNYYAYHDDYIY